MSETFEKYTIEGYTVSEEVDVLFDLWDMPIEALDDLEKAEKASKRGKSADYDRISRAIKKYPRIPFFKDLLINYYLNKGEDDKADELNNKILQAHPDYFVPYVHKALTCGEAGHFEKIPEILGENFDLKACYPTRSVFYIEEFLKMQYAAVLYFFQVGQVERATDRLRIMNETAPYNEITILAREFIKDRLDNHFNDGEGDMNSALIEKYIGPTLPEQPLTQKTKAPTLKHKEVKALYIFGYDLPRESIEAIKVLPRKTLMQDLVSVLDDSLSRYTYLTEEFYSLSSDEMPKYQFVEHAIFMLAEIKAVESRTLIYKMLNQSLAYNATFLSTVLEQEILDSFYILLAGDPKRIVKFIKQPAKPTAVRVMLLNVLKEIAFQEPDKKLLIQNFYDELIDFFLASKREDNVQDNILMDALVLNLVLINATKSFSKIWELRSKEMLLSLQVLSDDVLQDILGNVPIGKPLKFLPMAARYAEIEIELQNLDNEDFEADDYGEADFANTMVDQYHGPEIKSQPVTTEVKKPVFNHPEIEVFYYWEYDIPEEKIDAIRALPRKTLIEDLETLLKDSLNRFTHLTEDNSDANSEFVVHAIFMLAEIKAVESAPLIFEILGQSDAYFDWFLIDICDRDLLEPLYTLLSNNADDLRDFILLPGKAAVARINALDILKEIALQKPNKKLMVLGYFNQIVDFLLSSTPEDNVQDTMVIDGIIMNLIDLSAVAFLPKIKKFKDLNMSVIYKLADMDTIEKSLRSPHYMREKLQLLPMMERYREVQAEIDADFEADFEDENNNFDRDAILSMIPEGVSQEALMSLMGKAGLLMEDADQERKDLNAPLGSERQMSVVKSAKVGRNDPCACGSGKKYKKCCLNK